jgi:hypothetical protein
MRMRRVNMYYGERRFMYTRVKYEEYNTRGNSEGYSLVDVMVQKTLLLSRRCRRLHLNLAIISERVLDKVGQRITYPDIFGVRLTAVV